MKPRTKQNMGRFCRFSALAIFVGFAGTSLKAASNRNYLESIKTDAVVHYQKANVDLAKLNSIDYDGPGIVADRVDIEKHVSKLSRHTEVEYFISESDRINTVDGVNWYWTIGLSSILAASGLVAGITSYVARASEESERQNLISPISS